MSILQNDREDTIIGLSGSPKTMFILGLSIGVGSMAVLALILTLVVVLNGSGISFAKGTPDKGTVTDTANEPTNTGDTAQLNPVPEVTGDDHVRGATNPKVTLIEYSDFQCPYCSRHAATIEQALKDYPNDVQVVYRHFPLTSIHPFAQKAGVASECAAQQGKFWEMHDKLFALTSSAEGMTLEGIKKAGSELGIDTNKFNTCLDNDETLGEVTSDYEGAIPAGVEGTPATFINGELVSGALPYVKTDPSQTYDSFQDLLKAAGATK